MKLILLILIGFAVADYSEIEAKRYVWASSLAYCDWIGADDCGKAGLMVKNLGYEILSFK